MNRLIDYFWKLNYPVFEKETRKKIFLFSLKTFWLGIIFTLLYLLLAALSDGVARNVVIAAMIVLLVFSLARSIYGIMSGQTWFGARVKEAKRARKTALSSKAELMAYAEKMKEKAQNGQK